MTPTLHPRGADSLMDFLKQGLGAEEESSYRLPDGTVALAGGGTSIEAPGDQPYGERRAGVKDPLGNSWYFSAPVVRTAVD